MTGDELKVYDTGYWVRSVVAVMEVMEVMSSDDPFISTVDRRRVIETESRLWAQLWAQLRQALDALLISVIHWQY